MENTEYKWDIFIGHSSDKADIARKIMDDLESRFGIQCCFADRDFEPGKGIPENIKDCMRRSSMILLMICKDFINSKWCWYEQEEAFIRYIEEKGKLNCVIPVLFEDTQLPERLENITYIKFQNVDDLVEKLHQAYSGKNKTIQFLGGQGLGAKPVRVVNDSIAGFARTLPSKFWFDDDFEDANERIEFMTDETDVKCLQDYFNKAVMNGDWDLLQCILKNCETHLTSVLWSIRGSC